MKEFFNPRDKKYQRIEDLPEEVRGNFVETEDGSGFIRDEAAEYDKLIAQKAKRRGTLSEKLFGDKGKVTKGRIIKEQARRENEDPSRKKDVDDTNFRYKLADEQVFYENHLKTKKAQEILSWPEASLEEMSTEEKLKLLEELEFSGDADDLPPTEILLAEERIFKTYKPSEKLKEVQERCIDKSLVQFGKRRFLKLYLEWNSYSSDRKKDLLLEWIDVLKDNFLIQGEIGFIETEDPSGYAQPASFYPSPDYEKGEVGCVIFKSYPGKDSFPIFSNSLSCVVHEFEHAFQAAILKNLVNPDLDGLAKDKDWFGYEPQLEDREKRHLKEMSDEGFNGESYYRGMPKERDAYQFQDSFEKKFIKLIDKERGKILDEGGFPSWEEIEKNKRVAKWAQGLLDENEDWDGRSLRGKAEQSLKNEAPQLIADLFGRLNRRKCLENISFLISQKERAEELIKISVSLDE
jgi:hypothetical protein